MTSARTFFARRSVLVVGTAIALLLAGIAGRALLARDDGADDAGTVEVTRGDYADIVEIRGEVQPVRSTYVSAPYNAGELQILKIAGNGTEVQAGDVVAEFDAVNLRRTIQEKQGELRSAQAELEQSGAQARITLEERNAAVARAEFDVTRAKLSLGEIGLVSQIEAERARLALADAEQRLREAQAARASILANNNADREARNRTIEKIRAELTRAEGQVVALQVKAPTDGTVSIMPNYRSAGPMGTPQEFRAGDRAWPGAVILELPDLSAVYLTARIDEADRGQLAVGQRAVIRLDAIADRDYQARVSNISLLARVDFSSGWPPPKQFDLTLEIEDPDDRLRPGMSAASRITVGQVPNVLVVPPGTIFNEAGRTVVFRRSGRAFEPVAVEVIRRGREQAAVAGGLEAGDRISRVRPGTERQEDRP